MAAIQALALLFAIEFLSRASGELALQAPACSYYHLMQSLNLTSSNEFLQSTRPVVNWTTPSVVSVDMILRGILGVDDKLQLVTLHTWIGMNWRNEFLSWNSSDFCGIDVLHVPRALVWIPDIDMEQEASGSGSALEDPLVVLRSSGRMSAGSRQQLSITCNLDLFKFPFDRQDCDMDFHSLSYGVESLQLTAAYNTTALMTLSKQTTLIEGEWMLVDLQVRSMTVGKSSNTSVLRYTVAMKRRPFLYIVNMIMPLLFLLLLDLGSFFITGDKLGFKMTILLSIFVILLNLQSILPSTEVELPMMAIYCLVVFVLVWLGVLEVVLVDALNELDDSRAERKEKAEGAEAGHQPKAAASPETIKDPNKEKGDEEEKEEAAAAASARDPEQPDDLKALQLILDLVRGVQRGAELQGGRRQRKSGCFRRLARLIHVLFFAVYLTTVVVFLLVLFVLWIPDWNPRP